MKRIVVIVTLLSLLMNCSYSLKKYSMYERGKTIILDEKVGESIDVEERQQFDLLPGVEGFKEARFYSLNEGGCEIKIVTDKGNFRTISRDPLTVDILGDYINAYGDITFSRENLEKKWRIVDYDSVGLPITQIEVNHVERKNFRYIHGVVGAVTCGAFLAYLLEGPFWAVLGGLAGG
ncbi:MAG: hypothetical protein JSV53_03995 [candidate division WOR-3 bacterium]|nr:MAG: hypothetical protein JSV53_03995 [candidate division WOR-3 bacterium]